MKHELDYYLNEPRFRLKSRRIRSIYIGGGTPSLAKPSTIEGLLNHLDQAVGLSHDTEITMEANPTSVETTSLQNVKSAGVNRLSIGIQSLLDHDLTTLGRDHSRSDGFRALAEANRIFGPHRVSFDLIFARPGQTCNEWEQELKQALDLAGGHMSIYQLTMERSSPLHKAIIQKKIRSLPDEDKIADMYEATVDITRQSGLHQYEVSSYCRDESTISRHNFAYWQGIDYLGIGPGAHGRLTDISSGERIRTFGEFHPDTYMTLCEAHGEGIRQWKSVKPSTTLEEIIVFGMRTLMGVPNTRFDQFASRGLSLDKVLRTDVLQSLVDAGFIVFDKHRTATDDLAHVTPRELVHELNHGGLRPTQAGLARIDSILPQLLDIPSSLDRHESG